jgi:hypothetical protein
VADQPKVVVTIIDPPEGWMYGFPKIVPKWVKPDFIDEWVVSVGYPRAIRDKFNEHFYYRYWSNEVEVSMLPKDYYERGE